MSLFFLILFMIFYLYNMYESKFLNYILSSKDFIKYTIINEFQDVLQNCDFLND